jgi:hypothetical protein
LKERLYQLDHSFVRVLIVAFAVPLFEKDEIYNHKKKRGTFFCCMSRSDALLLLFTVTESIPKEKKKDCVVSSHHARAATKSLRLTIDPGYLPLPYLVVYLLFLDPYRYSAPGIAACLGIIAYSCHFLSFLAYWRKRNRNKEKTGLVWELERRID